MNEEYKKYRQDKIQEGLEFQDIMMETLFAIGIALSPYTSIKRQIESGENIQGIEIKHDGNFRETGNLWIEGQEKSNPDKANYVSSGIYREDNSWLFLIGDEVTAYLFAIKHLRAVYPKYRLIENNTRTSRGILMPIRDAEKYCIRKIEAKKTRKGS